MRTRRVLCPNILRIISKICDSIITQFKNLVLHLAGQICWNVKKICLEIKLGRKGEVKVYELWSLFKRFLLAYWGRAEGFDLLFYCGRFRMKINLPKVGKNWNSFLQSRSMYTISSLHRKTSCTFTLYRQVWAEKLSRIIPSLDVANKNDILFISKMTQVTGLREIWREHPSFAVICADGTDEPVN